MRDLFSSTEKADRNLKKLSLVESIKMESYDGGSIDSSDVRQIITVAPEIIRAYKPEHNFLLASDEENEAIALEAVTSTHIKMGIGVAVMMLVYKIFQVLFNNSSFEMSGGGGGGRGTAIAIKKDIETIKEQQQKTKESTSNLTQAISECSPAHPINEEGSKENNRLQNLTNKIKGETGDNASKHSVQEMTKIISETSESIPVSGVPKLIIDYDDVKFGEVKKTFDFLIELMDVIERWGDVLNVKQDCEDYINTVLTYFNNKDTNTITNMQKSRSDNLATELYNLFRKHNLIDGKEPVTDIGNPLYSATLLAPLSNSCKTIFVGLADALSSSDVKTVSLEKDNFLDKMDSRTEVLCAFNDKFKTFVNDNKKLGQQVALEKTKEVQDKQETLHEMLKNIKINGHEDTNHSKEVIAMIDRRSTFFKSVDQLIFNSIVVNLSKTRKELDKIDKTLKTIEDNFTSITEELDRCIVDAKGEVV